MEVIFSSHQNEDFILAPDEAHVWFIPLEVTEKKLIQCWYFLSEGEQKRAKQFQQLLHQNYFIVAHGILNQLLSFYVSINEIAQFPSTLAFTYNKQGKPFLVNSNIQFNLSHSNNTALIAMTHAIPVGVDIERIDSKHEVKAIAERFFTRHEYETLASLNKEDEVQAFFALWTRKEAFLKAIGKGLSQSLQTIEIESGFMEPGAQIAIKFLTESVQNTGWLYALPEPTGYATALATQNKLNKIKVIQYSA
jgi:4'-phosphopantetheinyl transferase